MFTSGHEAKGNDRGRTKDLPVPYRYTSGRDTAVRLRDSTPAASLAGARGGSSTCGLPDRGLFYLRPNILNPESHTAPTELVAYTQHLIRCLMRIWKRFVIFFMTDC